MLYTVFISKGQYGPASGSIRLDGMSLEDATGLARLMLVHGEDSDVILRPELEKGDDSRTAIAG